MTAIEWSDATWNPTVGCSRVSPGCENCYAERVAHRGLRPEHAGLTVMGARGPRWNGTVRCLPGRLEQPLHWQKPRRVFVDSMSDLFHEDVPDDFIDRVFAVMALSMTLGHQFQILTKRAERMRRYVGAADVAERVACEMPTFGRPSVRPERVPRHLQPRWPLPNVWLGVSVEDQQRADDRIPLLLATPAAVRFVSAEPLLGPLELHPAWLSSDAPCAVCSEIECSHVPLHWIIVGGESGPGARPCEVGWLRSIVAQCTAAGVPCFVKQMGRWLRGDADGFVVDRYRYGGRIYAPPLLRAAAWAPPPGADFTLGRKGNVPLRWPGDLRVRDFPRAAGG